MGLLLKVRGAGLFNHFLPVRREAPASPPVEGFTNRVEKLADRWTPRQVVEIPVFLRRQRRLIEAAPVLSHQGAQELLTLGKVEIARRVVHPEGSELALEFLDAAGRPQPAHEVQRPAPAHHAATFGCDVEDRQLFRFRLSRRRRLFLGWCLRCRRVLCRR